MEKDRLDNLIKESLRKEVQDTKMSSSLRESILKSTVKKPDNIFKRFVKLMNLTVEIPLPSLAVLCIILCVMGYSGLSIIEGVKKDKSIIGYTSVKTVKIGGSEIIVESQGIGGNRIEK